MNQTNKRNIGKITFYCDESCHIKNDNSDFMAIGAIYCRKDRGKELISAINEIKSKYKITKSTELKWNKISNSTLDMYKEIFSFINERKVYKIRIVLINKNAIDSLSRWYYKAYYYTIATPIDVIMEKNLYTLDAIEIYSDFKDTNSFKEMEKTKRNLSKHFNNLNLKVKSVVCNSKDFILIQIADILSGAATYKNRKETGSPAKLELIKHIENLFDINLSKTTKRSKIDYNVFVYNPKKVGDKNEF